GAAEGWTISHDTVTGNSPGAGVILGTNGTITDSCLSDNGQYGFQVTSNLDASPLTHGPSNVTVKDNEISGNDTYNWEAQQGGCGCSGGAKFWEVDGATVTDNFVHDNHNVGLWADTNDTSFDISGNFISGNFGEGIIYEISYNASIVRNTFVDNAWGNGPTNPGFPTGAIYISESGGDPSVPGPFSGELLVKDDILADNWSGVVLWESADRFCGSPNNSSTGTCTLGDPRTVNISSCDAANLASALPGGAGALPDYYELCRWKTQNVSVEDDTFIYSKSRIPGCDGTANSCGENAVFSQWGTSPSWSPYKGDVIENAITFRRDNRFQHNVYLGPWRFMAHDQATVVDFSTWQHEFHQDVSTRYLGDWSDNRR
ncbi:MAG: right-handed parallel beta-helix repeat-containing protein, partial [Acidimicrobiales bacterium]